MPAVDDSEGWNKVAVALEEAIRSRGLTYGAIATATGVNYRTIKKLLDGEPVTRRDRLAALARAFDWPPDAFDRIRTGEDPASFTVAGISAHSGIDVLDELSPEELAEVLRYADFVRSRRSQ